MHKALFWHLYSMKAFPLAILLILIISSCGLQSKHKCDEVPVMNSVVIDSSTNKSQSYTSIKGTVFDENGEALMGTTVLLQGTEIGASVDLDGTFEIKNIQPGTYKLIVKCIGYNKVFSDELTLQEGEQVVLKKIILYRQDIELKPIIYFYPTDTINLHVQLNYDGEIIHTYPESNSNWEMIAYPDGTLIDSTGRSYYSIYWEGITPHQKTMNTGFIVNQSETITFLEEKLANLGLNEREANEFIIFWLPILNQNAKNFIHFDTEHYIQYAALNIQPVPETLIRIMMLHCPIDVNLNIPEQIISTSGTLRKGFTVVEWGGKKISLSQLESQ